MALTPSDTGAECTDGGAHIEQRTELACLSKQESGIFYHVDGVGVPPGFCRRVLCWTVCRHAQSGSRRTG